MRRGQEEKTQGEFSLPNPQEGSVDAGFFSSEEGSSDMNWACSFFSSVGPRSKLKYLHICSCKHLRD